MTANCKEFVLSIESSIRTEAERSVINSTESFLKSEKSSLMEMCFLSIRNNNNERCFMESIDEIEDSEFDSLFPLVSNVIITANKIECDVLNYVFAKQNEAYIRRRKHNLSIIPGHNVGVADAYLIKLKSSFYLLHINAFETGSNTPGGSTDIVRFISDNQYLKPASIISFGVCYGRNPNKQNIGDVIIPQKLYPWSIGQKIVDKTLKVKNDDFNLWLFSLFDKCNIYSILRDYCNGEDGKTIDGSIALNGSEFSQSFKVRTTMGNMSTGEAVVSSECIKDIIVEATGNYKELGGEMEGYGLAKECVYYANIPCVIIKSICDWGVLKNIENILDEEGIAYPCNLKDKLQSYAAFCSGIVLIDLFNREKEALFYLELVKHITGSLAGRNFLNGNTGCSEKRINNQLRKFYSIDHDKANRIFTMLLHQNILVRPTYKNDEFFINQSVLGSFTSHGYY